MARKLLISFVSLIWCVPSLSINFTIPYVTPKECKGHQYFQFSSLRCVDCGTPGQIRSEDALSCVCRDRYTTKLDRGGPPSSSLVCEKCNNTGLTTSSLNGSFCISCLNGTCSSCNYLSILTSLSDFLIRAENDSRVSKGDKGQCALQQGKTSNFARTVIHTFLPSTALFAVLKADGAYVRGVCSEETNSAKSGILTEDILFTSFIYERYLRAAQEECSKYSAFTACQLLGNLCVLLEYTEVGDNACKQFRDLVNDDEKFKRPEEFVNRDWPVVMPWLFYQNSASNAPEVLDKKDITKKFQTNEDMSFVFAVFTLNGSFVGFEKSLGVLQLCKDRPSKMAAASKFATTFESSCSVAVKDLMNKPMLFYDMYLVLGKDLYPVPLLVENYKLGSEKVNEGTDRAKWNLTRRFFIVDNLVGNRSANQPLKWIRYSEKIELSIRMRSTDGEIYPPVLRIRYKALDVQDKEVGNSNQDASFAVTYEMDMSKINKDTEIAVGCLSAVAVILALVKVTAWRRREGKLEIDGSSIMKFILFCFGTFSTMLFWVAFGMSIYRLVFFKRQKTIPQLLPSDSQEKLFLTLVYVSVTFKFIDVIHMLVSQILFEIFFVDWERPQGRVNQPADEGGTGVMDAPPVSIWRTLFIANEWNEIQTTRKINPELQIFLVLLFLKVLGFEYLATTDPVSSFSSDYAGEFSRVLRFAILSILFLVIEAGQWFFFAFIYERFVGDALGDFIDLCSMSNVSIFILENNRFGYYIHGRSVHGQADTNMWRMNEHLKREEENLCGKRGLEPNSERQTFEVEVPFKFREQYDDVVRPLRGMRLQRRTLPPNPTGQHSHPHRLPPVVEKRIQAYNNLNHFLSTFIDHSLRDMDYVVRDKLLFEHVLNMEFKELPPVDRAIFYNNNSRSFNSILFYGNEWTLMMFDLLVFAFIDLFSQDFVLAGIITYFVTKFLIIARDTLGRKNLTRKTLVDERFLT